MIDVVIPVYRNLEFTRACVDSVLAHSGALLGNVLLIDDCSPEQELSDYVAAQRLADSRIRAFKNASNRGFVQTANLGLAASDRDVVLLNSDARVTSGWLDRLSEALLTDSAWAALSPLSNHAGMCSVPDYGSPSTLSEADIARFDLSGLPMVTELPTAHGFCVLLRREALNHIGPLDPRYGRGYHEENDWCQRARRAGWKVGRANHAFVFHHGQASFKEERNALEQANGWRLVRRYPSFFEDARKFDESPLARVASRAVRASLGKPVDDDFSLVRPGRAGRTTSAHVGLLGDDDLLALESGALDGFLASVQGVLAPVSMFGLIERRGVRCAPSLGEPTAFYHLLARKPDTRALTRQGR
jgi:GT2 family glycosyltransferase